MKKNGRLYFNILVVFVILPALCIFSVRTLDSHGFFKIQKIDIGVESLSQQKAYIKKNTEKLLTELEPYKGESLLSVSLQKMSDIVKSEPWIKDYRISRSWPSTVKIQIESHEIAYLLTDSQKLGQGSLRPVTETAQLLPEIDSRTAPSVALLKGSVFLKEESKRQKAIELLKSLPATGKLAVTELSEVNYDNQEGFWISLIHSDVKVKLGEEQFALKSARVSQVMDYLEKKDLNPRVIDANLSKKVLVRLQQSP